MQHNDVRKSMLFASPGSGSEGRLLMNTREGGNEDDVLFVIFLFANAPIGSIATSVSEALLENGIDASAVWWLLAPVSLAIATLC